MIDDIEVEPEDYASMLTGYLQRADALPREFEWLGKLVRYQDQRIEEYRLLQDLIVQANSGMELSTFSIGSSNPSARLSRLIVSDSLSLSATEKLACPLGTNRIESHLLEPRLCRVHGG